ncbi:hypothetical protein COLO4_34130 [Corchorus olitorius]|uniref:Uncharacterized protein n=1 Tax=Corchorus olitorius TaxID=93759 RepID=A0A1R3GNI9_9ROSI|nr:hypothetical protein COLO4_34130 [Corchorus olitorius]
MTDHNIQKSLIIQYRDEAQALAEYKRMKEIEKRCGGEGSWILKVQQPDIHREEINGIEMFHVVVEDCIPMDEWLKQKLTKFSQRQDGCCRSDCGIIKDLWLLSSLEEGKLKPFDSGGFSKPMGKQETLQGNLENFKGLIDNICSIIGSPFDDSIDANTLTHYSVDIKMHRFLMGFSLSDLS